MGGMSLGEKIVVVIRTECCEEIVLNATKLTHAMQKTVLERNRKKTKGERQEEKKDPNKVPQTSSCL